ncbi:MAG: phosphoenolpyruvate carboxylase, partial [Omnitrophica WOR_2 bacterium RIFCSPHIGHO2_02_FULL_48_11]
RNIPSTIATQHPDNAGSPYWDKGDGYVSVAEEPEECLACFRDLDVQEFMWDWEGKYADEAVIEKLLSRHLAYFTKHLMGRDKFLTLRLPNVWKEKGYSLIRALMVILTSEDVARDLKLKTRPLFEVILPMTERAEQLMYIQKSFQKLAHFKCKVFDHRTGTNTDHVEIIPLIEGVKDQIHVKALLSRYLALHKKSFHRKPGSLRPFLGRSDPALLDGHVASVLANKVALSEIYAFGKANGISVYPIIGAGSLIFRGGLSPARVRRFVAEYRGVRTVTIQSAFRYDYPLREVKTAIRYLHRYVPKSRVQSIDKEDYPSVCKILEIFSRTYRSTVSELIKDMEPLFGAVPQRRERRQHTGLMAYQRHIGKAPLPRTITFAAAWYSLGIPPEFIGLGRALDTLNAREVKLLKKYYVHFKQDICEAGRYINRENVRILAKRDRAWRLIEEDIERAEKFLGVRFGPKTKMELLHARLASQLLKHRTNKKEMARLITETGMLRKSLG